MNDRDECARELRTDRDCGARVLSGFHCTRTGSHGAWRASMRACVCDLDVVIFIYSARAANLVRIMSSLERGTARTVQFVVVCCFSFSRVRVRTHAAVHFNVHYIKSLCARRRTHSTH